MSIAPEQASADVPVTLNDFLMPEEEEQQEEGASGDESLDDSQEELDLSEEALPEEGEEAEDEAEDEQAPGIPLPPSWSKEDAEAWSALSPEAQAVVARREGERDKYIRKVGFEASQTKQQVENQAREVLAQMHDQHAQALAVYAQQFAPQAPDQRLLYTGNPDDVLIYQRQDAAYRAGADQQQMLHRQIQQAQAEANHARDQAQQAELVADAQRLKEQFPEWFEPSAGHQQNLQAIGAELGYSDELMAQASSADILALKKAADWKAKAEKYDKLVAKKMEGVRAAKGMPRMAKPGMKPTRGQQTASTVNRRNEALQSFGHTRDGNAAAALLFERKR